MKRRGVFIAGTDTGVGKTRVTVGLVTAWRAAGLSASGMKPVSAGENDADRRKINDDILKIAAASGIDAGDLRLARYRLRLAASPHIGARTESIRIDVDQICRDYDDICRDHALIAVEGAGGWHAPIDERRTMEAVARALGLPIILVVGLRLGCLNHAALTAEAITRSGLLLAGWVANTIDPAMDAAEREENVAWLEGRLSGPRLAWLAFDPLSTEGLTEAARTLAE